MALATAGPSGEPTVRMVLLKGYDRRGLVFYTHRGSRKGCDLAANPRAALLFFWGAHERQVRAEGRVEEVSAEEADAYFRSRPLGSRLGAWASPQSRPVADRAELEARRAEASARFGSDPPRPPGWTGYRLLPLRFEFWQGRADRLHDRLLYTHTDDQGWRRQRLGP